MSIWKYEEKFSPRIDHVNRIELNVGNTQLQTLNELAEELTLNSLLLKREDENPFGSHKDRSLTYQISAHLSRADSLKADSLEADSLKADSHVATFVLSSSGNAAISAAAVAQKAKLTLHLFLSQKIQLSKLRRLSAVLQNEINPNESDSQFKNIHLHFRSKPVQEARKFANANDFHILNATTDPYAIEGYKTIGFELQEQAPETDAIFIASSSGTAALGIYNAYIQEGLKPPQMHILQTTKVNKFVNEFDSDFIPEKITMARAITDISGARKNEIHELIKNSGGSGWVLSNQEIIDAMQLLKLHNVEVSAEGAMSLAGLIKAKKAGWKFNNPVCIITGK